MLDALVTGASRGVGAEVARCLARSGHRVVGIYRSDVAAAAQVAEAYRDSIAMMQTDLSSVDEVMRLGAALSAQGHSFSRIALCAGTTVRASFSDFDADRDPLVAQVQDNLIGPLSLLRMLLRASVIAPPASVVFVGSNLARHGVAQRVAYGAAKGGLESATRGLARELGPAGIRVNTVAPGLLRTDMTAAMTDVQFEEYRQSVPLRRVGMASDVAPVIEFLLGDGARYITGQTVDVDGGWGA